MLFSEDPMWIELARDESFWGLGWCIYMYVYPRKMLFILHPHKNGTTVSHMGWAPQCLKLAVEDEFKERMEWMWLLGSVHFKVEMTTFVMLTSQLLFKLNYRENFI
jgi:hypothetical protein